MRLNGLNRCLISLFDVIEISNIQHLISNFSPFLFSDGEAVADEAVCHFVGRCFFSGFCAGVVVELALNVPRFDGHQACFAGS